MNLVRKFRRLAFRTPTRQAIVAQEIKTLYDWWKYERPKRIDPYEIKAGANSDKVNKEEHLIPSHTPESVIKLRRELEKKYFNEDTEMLIRLIRIRDGLWT